jgi:hypothetical protein
MQFTQFENTTPVIVPAIAQKEYPKFWLEQLTIVSGNTSTARLYAKFIPCRDLENGEKELKLNPTDNEIKVVQIDNIWDLVSTAPEFAIAMESVFQALNNYGVTIGVFKAKE